MALPRVSRRTVRALQKFVEAIFSAQGQPPDSERLEFTVSEYEELLAYGGLRTRLLVAICLWAVGWFATFFIGRLGSTWRLPLPDRVQAIGRMEAHPFWGPPVLAVKATLCMIYYEHPSSEVDVGFLTQGLPPPPPVSLAS